MNIAMERPTTPAAIAAATEIRQPGCAGIPTPSLKGFEIVAIGKRPIRRKAPTKAGSLDKSANHLSGAASPTQTSERARSGAQTNALPPLAGSTIRDAASDDSQTTTIAPHHEPIPYTPDSALQDIIDDIRDTHRLRQNMIRAQMRLELQAQATIRLPAMSDADFADDEAKAKAKKRVADLYSTLKKAGPAHELYANIAPFLAAQGPLAEMRDAYEKRMVKLAKQLPAYAWAKSVKGLGDISFATLVGECGDIGSYKSVSAVWKRLGLAVMDGKRQGSPGEGASAEDWIAHGYSGKRRSVSWNARNQIIGGMGLWRPQFGEDVEANEELTEYQRVFAARARYEAEKLGVPVKCSDKGKESYSKHVINRAMRYTEKRMIKHLYLAWRRGGVL